MTRLITFLTLAAGLALMPSSAFAQSDVSGYGGQGGRVESAVSGSGSGSGSDALPFSGLEVGMLLAIAISLALVGYTLRRLTHHGARGHG